MVDLLPYFTIGGIVVAVIVGLFQIKESIKKRSEEQQEAIKTMISTSDTNIISHIDDRLKIVDKELEKTKEDIQDVEGEVKKMKEDFSKICETITKHNFIVEEVLPDFKKFREQFYEFKGAVDVNLVTKKPDNTINTNEF